MRRAMIADHGSIRVSVDYCFSRSCEGDRVNLGPSANPTSIVEVGAKAVGHRPNTDPRPYSFRAHRRRSVELIVLPANRSKRLCLRIQFLRIERFSFLPNSQRNGGNLARQRQPRHLGPYPLLLETLNVAAVRLAPATRNGRADEQLF